MAATWAIKITVTSIGSELVTVEGIRTDGEDVRTYNMSGVSVNTYGTTLAAIKLKVVTALHDLYLEEITRESSISDMVGGWEAAVKADLDQIELDLA